MIVFDQLKKSDPQLRLLTFVVLAGLAILLGGLWFVQIITSQRFIQREQTQSFRTVRIPAPRGKILDRNGFALAENRPSYNLALYLEELRPLFGKEFDRIRPMTNAPALPFWKRWLGFSTPAVVPAKLSLAQRTRLNEQARYSVVSNLFAEVGGDLQQPLAIEPGLFQKHYNNSLVLPLPVMFNLTPPQIARVQEQSKPLPGLSLEIQPLRRYPRRATASHVLGQLQSDNNPPAGESEGFRYRLPDYRGKVGIEGAFDEALRGHAGMKAVLVNNLGYRQSEQVWLAAEPGMNVVLTIDLIIQQAVELELQRAAVTKGAVVVMDPNSGDIYAMASTPNFDPNEFIPRLGTNYQRILGDEDLRPAVNRVLQDNYSAGSIIKILTSLVLLEDGLDVNEVYSVKPNPSDPAHGHIKVGTQTIKDTASPGEYNFHRAFIRSSNSYFIYQGLKMQNGLEKFLRMAQAFHLGERTGIPTKQEVPGTLPTKEWRERNDVRIGQADLGYLCIGQGYLDVTPMQMAVMTAAIANGGKVLRPRLVSRLEPQEPFSEQTAQVFAPGQIRDTLPVSQRTLNIVRDAMRDDVADPIEGSGKSAAVSGWQVCGKTGTAENDLRRNRGKTTWFASFAPYEAPRYVVLVMVEGGSSGGNTCAPVAGQIYRAIQRREQMSQTRVLAGRSQ